MLFAFLMTLFAGLSTSFGLLFAFNKNVKKEKVLPLALGLSAGVMVYVSFIEIFPKGYDALSNVMSEDQAYLVTTLGFFAGILIVALIDYLVPKKDNPHEYAQTKNVMYRLGVFSAIAIALHNFPEGIATFIASLEDQALGVSIAIAIAIHNIPEGLAVAVPIYYATQSKKKTITLTVLSGLAEPLGALVGYFILYPFLNDYMFGIIFSVIAGFMVYIAIDELLPTAENFKRHHLSITGFIIGMMIMALSLILF